MAGATINLSTVANELGTVTPALVKLSNDSLLAGYIRPLSEVDAGRSRGTPHLLANEVSEDYRARVELDTLLDSYTFNDAVQNTAKHIYRTSTMTNTWSGGYLNTNAGSSVAIGGTSFLTYQYFPVNGGAQTYAYFKLRFTGTWAVTNTTIDVGFLGTPAITTPFAPTDGAFMRANSSGLQGVLSNNGVEVLTTVFKSFDATTNFSPTIGTEYDCIVTIGENAVVFWIDLRDGNGYAMVGRLNTPIGSGRPLLSGAVQFGIRHGIAGAVASAVQSASIASYAVIQGGFNYSRSMATQMSMMGASGAQGQSGHAALTSTALYTNSLAPGVGAAMTNTTAALGAGLGGQFSALPTLVANTDGIVCSYLCPIASNVITGKQLVVTRIRIESVVTTVLVGNATPIVYAYSLAWGHTGISLTTGEGPATKASRRKVLGLHTFAAAAALSTLGGAAIDIELSDVVLNPGEYIQLVAKNIGAVTTTGVVTFFVTVNSHWV